ncbi:MAG: phage portal protein [Sedimentisphaerales bacterium]|nr:phage portal protein [Sedimentisphaerales bacterium]
MSIDLSIFEDPQINADFIEYLIDERSADIQSHFSRLWEYYANRMVWTNTNSASEQSRNYIQAQEVGLPSRITGGLQDIKRKEVVIENDIAWRVNAMVDFLFGKPISIKSLAPEANKQAEIERILKVVFEANGAIGFFQNMGVIGSVYGFVDCVIRPAFEKQNATMSIERVLEEAARVDLELIDSPRALPILDEDDYRKIRYYVQHFEQKKNSIEGKSSFLSRLLGQGGDTDRETVEVTEIISSTAWQRYEDKELVAEGELPWGFLPVVHIQNIAQPYYYEGISDVEPLIPLQDELNVRLSDRANRITFQSFKMYLGKGIEGFEDKPVSPGRMWQTDNTEAEIEEFGGDSATPSEDSHIQQIRDAIDKVSGVPPVVTGNLKNKVGNLTSAIAIKLTFMGMLTKNDRKKFTYSEGLKKICKMVLSILDTANIYKTSEAEREIDINFPSPLPEDVTEKLEQAQIKKELGVPQEKILKELEGA